MDPRAQPRASAIAIGFVLYVLAIGVALVWSFLVASYFADASWTYGSSLIGNFRQNIWVILPVLSASSLALAAIGAGLGRREGMGTPAAVLSLVLFATGLGFAVLAWSAYRACLVVGPVGPFMTPLIYLATAFVVTVSAIIAASFGTWRQWKVMQSSAPVSGEASS